MGGAMSDTTDGSAHIQWMWNASIDPFSQSEPAEWKPYSDVETMIIEEAYQASRKHAPLDIYTVDFKHMIQILNNDRNKQRPVKRMVCGKDDIPVREERFTFNSISPKQSFVGLYGWVSPFVRAATKTLNITRR